ncbi:MAG: hypothetical protein MI919_35935, partial [Holophagales bacterium]|nr:hypothetical protein [Holophagales bacterium]
MSRAWSTPPALERAPAPSIVARIAARIAFPIAILITVPIAADPGGSNRASEAGPFSGGSYACRSLPETLEDLRSRGLGLVWSSDLVRPDMQIKMVPDASTPVGVLVQVLAHFGLKVKPAKSGVYLVVRDPDSLYAAADGPASRPAASGSAAGGPPDQEGMLPIWLDRRTGPARWPFPLEGEESPILPLGTRHLVVEVAPGPYGSWEDSAFELKTRIIEAGAESPGLRVALAGPRPVIEQLVAHGLAPYVHAYEHRGDPWVPPNDPTARSWYRSSLAAGVDSGDTAPSSAAGRVLRELLSASDRGDELVIFEDSEIDPWQQAWLASLQASPAADLDIQPQAFGVPELRRRFFLEPESGDHFVALVASGEAEELRFHLPGVERASGLFPESAEVELAVFAGGQALRFDGRFPYYLIRLEVAEPESQHGGVQVESTELVDPYEQVVANQVFQERELEKFHSLDVMEYLSSTPQYAGGDQITWEHRILQRKGKLTEYHHLGYRRNGVPYPEKKLLKGRLFRNEALLQLKPLEVELDETYRYTYLGEEDVDGRRAYHIVFEPVRQGTVEHGDFVKGELWLDRDSRAHLRIRTYQEGLSGQLVFQDRTYHYDWIYSDGECFWDWRRREGHYVTSYLGRQYPVSTRTERVGFRYNRPDIEQVARAAYDSDLLIHVESPPEGHRWLVKVDGERRLGGLEHEPYPASGRHTTSSGDWQPAAEPRPSDPGAGPEGGRSAGRVLADVHAFSRRSFFSLGGFGSSDADLDLFPGIVLTDSDFLDRGLQAEVGAFKDYGLAAVGVPNLFGKGWVLSAALDLPWQSEEQDAERTVPTGDPGPGAPGDDTPEGSRVADTTVDVLEPSLAVGLAVPLDRRFTLNAVYTLRHLDFTRTGRTDPAFVMPEDTLEHGLDLSLAFRHRHWTL